MIKPAFFKELNDANRRIKISKRTTGTTIARPNTQRCARSPSFEPRALARSAFSRSIRIRETVRLTAEQAQDVRRTSMQYNSGFTLPATAYCQSVAGGGSASGCSNTAYAGGSLSVGNDSQVNGFDVDGSGNALDSVGNLSTASQTLGALTPASFPSYNGTTDYSGSASNLGSRCRSSDRVEWKVRAAVARRPGQVEPRLV